MSRQFGLTHRENSEGACKEKGSFPLEPFDPITESAQKEQLPFQDLPFGAPSSLNGTAQQDKNLTACFLVMIAQRGCSFIIILLREESICFCLPFVKSNLFLWIAKEINSPEMVPWWIGVHATHSVFIDKPKVDWMLCVYGVGLLKPAQHGVGGSKLAHSAAPLATSGDWCEGRFLCQRLSGEIAISHLSRGICFAGGV